VNLEISSSFAFIPFEEHRRSVYTTCRTVKRYLRSRSGRVSQYRDKPRLGISEASEGETPRLRGDIGDCHSAIFDQASDDLRSDLRQRAATAPVSQFVSSDPARRESTDSRYR
jgi:hypothetical protein